MKSQYKILNRGIFPSFKQDKRGVTAIEFAMIAPLFLFLTFAIIELSFYNYLRASVERVTHDIARQSMTGNNLDKRPTESRDAYFQRRLLADLNKGVFTGVQTQIKKEVYQSIQSYKNGKPVAASAGQFGGSNDILQLTVTAKYNFFTPLLGMLANQINSFAFTTTVFIKNEYF